MLVREFLERTAERHPDAIALLGQGQRWSFAELESAANALAHALAHHGVGRGDRVAVHLSTRPEALIADFAALKAGAAFVPLNRGLRESKLADVLRDCAPAALVTEGRIAGRGEVGRLIEALPSLRVVVSLGGEAGTVPADAPPWRLLDEILATEPDGRPDVVNIDRDLACLIYTSGSTGVPKGIMADHDAVSFASGSIIRYLELSHSDVVLCALPLSFDYGLYQPLMTCRLGARTVLHSSFAFPGKILTSLADEGVSGLPLVPSALALLLQLDLERFDLSALRFVTNTGAALPVPHIRALRARLPHVRIYSMYGLSETKRALYLPPEEIDANPDSVGYPIPGTEAWLEDERGRRVAPGGVGELVIRGRHVMRGYWNDPEATAQRFVPGPMPGERVCRSGDLFRQDRAGRFYFVARTDEVIKSRGEKVAPREVERALLEHPQVADACVMGVDDPVLGQAIQAVVVPQGAEVEISTLAAHCRLHLEDHMQPRSFHVISALPRNAAGKVDRRALVRHLEQTSQDGRAPTPGGGPPAPHPRRPR